MTTETDFYEKVIVAGQIAVTKFLGASLEDAGRNFGEGVYTLATDNLGIVRR